MTIYAVEAGDSSGGAFEINVALGMHRFRQTVSPDGESCGDIIGAVERHVVNAKAAALPLEYLDALISDITASWLKIRKLEEVLP